MSSVFLCVLPSLGHAVVLTSHDAPGSSLRQEETIKGISLNDSCLFSFKKLLWKFHPAAVLTPHWLTLTARESRTRSLLTKHVSSHEISLPSTSISQRMSNGRAPCSLSQPHCYIFIFEAVNSHPHGFGQVSLDQLSLTINFYPSDLAYPLLLEPQFFFLSLSVCVHSTKDMHEQAFAIQKDKIV